MAVFTEKANVASRNIKNVFVSNVMIVARIWFGLATPTLLRRLGFLQLEKFPMI